MTFVSKKSFNLIGNLTKTNLVKLGYSNAEAKWIKNLGKELTKSNNKKIFFTKNEKFIPYNSINDKIKKICVESDGHTNGTKIYTQTIIKSILLNGLDTWKINCVHLNYNVIFTRFYLYGFHNFAHELMLYNFSTPEEQNVLQNFNKNNDDKKSETLELKKLLEIICEKK